LSVIGNSGIPVQLLQLVISPFSQMGTVTDPFTVMAILSYSKEN